MDEEQKEELKIEKQKLSEVLQKKGLNWKILKWTLNIGLILMFICLVVYAVMNWNDVFATYKYVYNPQTNCTETYKNNILISPECFESGNIVTKPNNYIFNGSMITG